MKLIIDIPDKKYNEIKNYPMCYTEEAFEQIRKGTPLSEELEKIKEEVSRYGAICVQYTIKGHSERDIENIVEEVLKQAKSGFIDYLDKHISELKGDQE